MVRSSGVCVRLLAAVLLIGGACLGATCFTPVVVVPGRYDNVEMASWRMSDALPCGSRLNMGGRDQGILGEQVKLAVWLGVA